MMRADIEGMITRMVICHQAHRLKRHGDRMV
jgi:hypothetical protein